MQVELVMLDPYVRAPLRHDGAGRFAARVKLPDVYGVFKWVLDYRRPGYSYIELSGEPAVGGAAELGVAPGWALARCLAPHARPLGCCSAPHRPPAHARTRTRPHPRLPPATRPAETVPIRPFKHNEYERFIGQAFPYYASAASMMAGFLALGALLLWTK